MDVAMIYPSVKSENAMSNYSLDLIEALKKAGIETVKREYVFHRLRRKGFCSQAYELSWFNAPL